MNRQSALKTILLISLVLLTTNTIAIVYAKNYEFTATISPVDVESNQLATYLVNVTNTGDSTLGSTSIAIPGGFTVLLPITILNPPLTWNYTLSMTEISLTANSGGAAILTGESVIFTFDAIAPSSPGITTWTAQASTSIGGGGVKLTLKGAQPTVTVTSIFVAPTISASPVTVNQGQISLLSQLTGALGGTLPYTFQWLEAYNGGTFSPITGANEPDYIFSPTTSTATGTWSFKLNVTDSSSVPVTATSNTVNIIVNPELVAPEVTATPNAIIQTQPSTLTSTPVTTGTSPYTFQWFQKAPGGYYTTVGGNSATYTFPGTTTTGIWSFILQVTDNTGAKVNSTEVAITVSSTPVFTITVTQTFHGTITPGNTSVTLGSNQTFTISPEIGYQITDVFVDGISVGAVGSFVFIDVTADHQLTATFTPIEYTLTVSVIGSGTVTQSPTQASYHFGDVVQLTAIPTSGWRFSVWSGDLVGSTNPSSVTINGNKSVTAVFLTNQYSITAIAGTGGSISPPGITIVDHGGSQVFTITPNAGYHIVDVLINNTSVGPVSSYTASNITGDTIITASFSLNTLTIVASAGANGSISPNGIVTVFYGNDQSFVISPAIGYHIADVLVDGISVGAVTSYTFTGVTASHNITANFAIDADSYFINVVSSHGAPTASAQINPSANFTASVTSPEGDASHRWICTGYSLNGGTPISGISYTFINVQENHTIVFNWQEQYHVTVVSPDGLTTGTGWYNAGTTAAVSVTISTITVDNGVRRIFTGWTGDATGTNTMSTPMLIDSSKTATATWKTQYQVTYATLGNVLQVTAPPTEWVDQGTQVTGAFPTSITDSPGTTRTIFVGDNRPTAVNEPITVTGNYQTQYLVTLIQSGIASDASGTVVTILGETKTCEQLPNSLWINAGGSITFSYVATVESTATDKQYILTSTNFSSPLTINEPTTIQGYYEPKIISSSLPLSTIALAALGLSIPPSLAILHFTRRRKRSFAIKPIASEGGIISPSTTQTVEQGDASTVFIITADAGYKIADVVVDNAVHLGAIRTHKFFNVTENHTISATFCRE
jgi:hypothetical protein